MEKLQLLVLQALPVLRLICPSVPPLSCCATVRVKVRMKKVFDTVWACVIGTVQVLPLMVPGHVVQPPKVELAAAVAVRTTLPEPKPAKQTMPPLPQLMPAGLEVTFPVPVPLDVTVMVKRK